LFLASDGLAGLTEFLERSGTGPHAVFIPTAANQLDGRDFVDHLRSDLTVAGLRVHDLDIENEPVGDALTDADLVVVGGGDPFFLLGCARRAGLADAARAVIDRGGVYVGVSAGASIAGPDIAPLLLTSPFAAGVDPTGDFTGLGLCDVIVLPHHDRPGRRRKNRKAMRTYRDRWDVVAITDGQAVTVVEGVASVYGA
jgi:dipeptidase E